MESKVDCVLELSDPRLREKVLVKDIQVTVKPIIRDSCNLLRLSMLGVGMAVDALISLFILLFAIILLAHRRYDLVGPEFEDHFLSRVDRDQREVGLLAHGRILLHHAVCTRHIDDQYHQNDELRR